MEWGLENVSSRELTEWLAYEQVEGIIGHYRMDYHFARLMALIINMMKKAEDKVVTPKELMVWLDDEADDIGEVEDIFETMWAHVHGND